MAGTAPYLICTPNLIAPPPDRRWHLLRGGQPRHDTPAGASSAASDELTTDVMLALVPEAARAPEDVAVVGGDDARPAQPSLALPPLACRDHAAR